jgi:hypothetical protein
LRQLTVLGTNTGGVDGDAMTRLFRRIDDGACRL